VPWLRKFFRGEISRDAAAEGAIMDTRRYAKRQVTWFRNQMPGWLWTKPEEGSDIASEALATASRSR
jgi:tRNA dimethylallyltransferase